MQQDCHARLIHLLDLAMIPELRESAVHDFAIALFTVLFVAKPGMQRRMFLFLIAPGTKFLSFSRRTRD
jgi:hypothetical protein